MCFYSITLILAVGPPSNHFKKPLTSKWEPVWPMIIMSNHRAEKETLTNRQASLQRHWPFIRIQDVNIQEEVGYTTHGDCCWAGSHVELACPSKVHGTWSRGTAYRWRRLSGPAVAGLGRATHEKCSQNQVSRCHTHSGYGNWHNVRQSVAYLLLDLRYHNHKHTQSVEEHRQWCNKTVIYHIYIVNIK